MVTIATDYRKRIFRGAKIEELETLSRRLAENSLEQSKNNQNETVQESYYKDDIPKEAMEELKDIAPNFQKGMFEGMRFAYEQVANYISIMLATSDKLNEKHINNVLQHIQKKQLY